MTTVVRPPSRAFVERELRRIGADFATAVTRLLDELGIWEALARPEPRPAAPPVVAPFDPDSEERRLRRTNAELHQLCDRVLAVLQQQPEPLAISAIAARLALSPKDIAHPLVWLQDSGRVRRTGSRRGTRYRAVAPVPVAATAAPTRAAASRAATRGPGQGSRRSERAAVASKSGKTGGKTGATITTKTGGKTGGKSGGKASGTIGGKTRGKSGGKASGTIGGKTGTGSPRPADRKSAPSQQATKLRRKTRVRARASKRAR